MNRFTEKPEDSELICDGCNNTYTRESRHGVNCPECESYLIASEALVVNLAVHLERWRHRHGLSREGTIAAIRDFITLDNKWINMAMDCYSWTEARAAEKEEVNQ